MGYEGIDAVKEALRAGIAAGNPEIPIRINLIAPPVYVMTCSTPDKADGLAVLTDGCKAVEEKIVGSGGNFVMQMAPKVVTATDEDELAARIRKAEEENAVIFFCLHDIHPCYSVFNHLCLQLCLPTQRIDVKNPSSMMNCHIYTPLLLLPVFIHPCSLICTSSICMQRWCGVQGILCRSITKYCSI